MVQMCGSARVPRSPSTARSACAAKGRGLPRRTLPIAPTLIRHPSAVSSGASLRSQSGRTRDRQSTTNEPAVARTRLTRVRRPREQPSLDTHGLEGSDPFGGATLLGGPRTRLRAPVPALLPTLPGLVRSPWGAPTGFRGVCGQKVVERKESVRHLLTVRLLRPVHAAAPLWGILFTCVLEGPNRKMRVAVCD
jgi:hypothetical protein